jgi:hypothetical protein
MSFDLTHIERKTLSVGPYLDSLEPPFREKFLERKQTYTLNQEAANQLRRVRNKNMAIAFSAQWCKDCASNIPVLALISETTGLEVRIFGGLKKDPLSQTKKWRVPPSPPEVETFNVDKIPLIIVFDKDGKEVGRIVENPKLTPTLEEEIVKIVLEQERI